MPASVVALLAVVSLVTSLLAAAAAAWLGVAAVRQSRRLDHIGGELERLARRLETDEARAHAPGVARSAAAPAATPRIAAVSMPPRAVVHPQPDGSALGPTLIEVPDLSTPGTGADDAALALGRRFEGVWRRADAGESAEAIARATGQPIGQVELILGLRRRPASSSTATDGGGRPLP